MNINRLIMGYSCTVEISHLVYCIPTMTSLSFPSLPLQQDVAASAVKMVQRFGRRRYIANLGHGIYPDMSPERVKTLVDTIHQTSQQQ